MRIRNFLLIAVFALVGFGSSLSAQKIASVDMEKILGSITESKEQAVQKMQRDRFGPEGSLFQRRQELVKPIQDAIYEAIENYASTRGYDFIFDRAGSAGIIFANDTYDKTDDILRALKN